VKHSVTRGNRQYKITAEKREIFEMKSRNEAVYLWIDLEYQSSKRIRA